MELGKRNKQILTTALVIGIVLVLLGLFLLRTEQELSASGVVLPRIHHNLYAPEEATVVALHAGAGDTVTQGQPLVTLANTVLQDEREQLRQSWMEWQQRHAQLEMDRREQRIRPAPADLATALRRADLYGEVERIQNELARMYEAIRDQYIISEMDLQLRTVERLRAEIDGLESNVQADWVRAGLMELADERLVLEQRFVAEQVAQQERRVQLWDERLAALELVAPYDGVLAALDVRYTGERVAPGERLARVADPAGGYILRVLAPARNIDLVKPGLTVLVETQVFDATLAGRARGRVRRVIPEAVDHEAGLYEVEIEIEETPVPLMWGAPAQARIQMGRRSLFELLFQPQHAARLRQEEPQP